MQPRLVDSDDDDSDDDRGDVDVAGGIDDDAGEEGDVLVLPVGSPVERSMSCRYAGAMLLHSFLSLAPTLHGAS